MARTLVVYLGVFVAMTVGSAPGRANAQGSPIEVDFTNLGTFSTDELHVGEVTVTADDDRLLVMCMTHASPIQRDVRRVVRKV